MSGPSPVANVAGLVVGVAAHVLYFHRYECHMHALSYFNAFVAAYIGGVVALVQLYGWEASAAASVASSTAATFLIGAYGSLLVYRLFLNPLNRFPGPYPARLSCLWLSTQLGKSDGHHWLERMHGRYGKIVRIGSNDVSIIDPAVMEPAFGPKTRVTKAAWYDNDDPLTSMHTTRDKALHDRRRRVWAPAFSERALRDYEAEIERFTAQLVTRVGESGGGEAVNVSKWFGLFSFDVMGLLAFGKEYGMLARGEKPAELELLDEGMRPLAFRFPSWFFRLLLHMPGLGAGYRKFVQFCVRELAWRVRRRGDDGGGGGGKPTERASDIIGWLMKAYADVPHPERDVLLQADTRLIIVAGSDTTAAALTFLFYHLARNPDVVRRLRDELEPVTARGGAWHEHDIRGCEYLNGCINEALRLHPPVPSGVARLTPPEGMMVGDTWIPGNVTFIAPQYVMGRDEDVYAEAERFLPERWSSQAEKVKHRDAFAPFSTGPFGCIGKSLALMEIRMLTTRLILTYDLRLGPGETGFRLANESKDHFTFELADLWVRFTPRETQSSPGLSA